MNDYVHHQHVGNGDVQFFNPGECLIINTIIFIHYVVTIFNTDVDVNENFHNQFKTQFSSSY